VEDDLEGRGTPIWRARPVAEITRRDVIARLDEIKASRGKFAARHALNAIRRFFAWAAESERFGLDESPAERIKDKTFGIGGRDLKRRRVLDDDELRDVWEAAATLGYPQGSLVQELMLTGQRLNDVARARRPELDVPGAMLKVPPERYKSGVAHEVPLAKRAVQIIQGMPRFASGFIFTTTGGARPIGAFSKMKSKLDAYIAKAREKRDAEPMKPWILHDLRRTVRTRLMSDCGVDAFIAERVIGHALPGLHGVYDQGTHRPQKRAALEKWEAVLLGIVEPSPAKAARERKVVPPDEVERRRKRKRG